MRDINNVIDEIGLGTFHWVQLILVGGIAIADGAEILVSSSILGALGSAWGLTPIIKGAMMSTIFIGVFIGGILGGNLADTYGRRMAILLSYSGIVLFGVVSAATTGPWGMLVCRFLFGVSFGFGIGPGVALQVECAPASIRGHLVNLTGLWFAVGEIYTSVLLVVFMPDLLDSSDRNWRILTVLSAIPGIVLLPLTYFILQESPHFLFTTGQDRAALVSLKYIAAMNGREHVVRGLEAELGADMEAGSAVVHSERTPLTTAHMTIAEDEELPSSGYSSSQTGGGSSPQSEAPWPPQGHVEETDKAKAVNDSARYAIIFGAEYRGIALGGAYLTFMANFLFYGLTYALPQVFKSLGTHFSPAWEVLLISFCDIPGVIIAMLLIRSATIGHRDSMQILCVINVLLFIGLMGIDLPGGWVWVGIISANLAKFVSNAIFSMIYVYIGEVFPAAVRCTAVAFCISAGRVGSMIAPMLFEVLTPPGAHHTPFFGLCVTLLVLGVVVIRRLLSFELKNAPLEDIPESCGSKRASKRASLVLPTSQRTSRAGTRRGSAASPGGLRQRSLKPQQLASALTKLEAERDKRGSTSRSSGFVPHPTGMGAKH